MADDVRTGGADDAVVDGAVDVADAAGSAHPRGFDYDVPTSSRRSTPTSFLLDATRRRDVGRQALSVVTTLLFVVGGGLFTYPALTDVYTNQVVQNQAAEDFALLDNSVEDFDDYERQVRGQDGVAVTKIVIEAIDVTTLVVEGTTPDALRAGAGHYPDSPLPGAGGNVAIAGHRTTYGRPFNRLDELDEGDSIWLVTPVGDHRYVVTAEPASPDCAPTATGGRPDAAACITDPGDYGVVEEVEGRAGDSLLTLTTCHPKGSAAERLIIRAELAESFDEGHYDGTVAALDG